MKKGRHNKAPERKKDSSGPGPNLLFLRFKSIGDAILTTPCFEAVKRVQPDAVISVLADETIGPVFHGNPAIDGLLRLRASLAGKVRAGISLFNTGRGARGFEKVIDLHGGSTSAILSLLTRCPVRVGYGNYRFRRAYTHRCPQPRLPAGSQEMHTVDYRLFLMNWLGFKTQAPPRPKIVPSAQGLNAATKELSRLGLRPGRYAIIHPGATLESKRWPLDRYKHVAAFLSKGFKLKTLAVAGPGDGELLKEAFPEPQAHVALLPGPSLDTLIGLIAQAGFFLGNDSGPSHIAAALEIPQVAVFTSSNVKTWRPLSRQCVVVSAQVPCSPCPGYTCSEKQRFQCCANVDAHMVTRAVGQALSRLD